MQQNGLFHQYPFSPCSITIDTCRLSYLDEGQGPAVVLLHGNPSWSYLYRNLVAALRGRYRMIAPDHMGCGLSDKPRKYPYRLTRHIGNLEILLDTLAVEKCVLVVHDWGGTIGMGWAGRHPDRVAGLVVLNTAAFRSNRIPWRIALCGWPIIGPVIVRGLNGFARAAVSMAVTRKMAPAVAAGFLAPYDSWNNRIALFRFVQDIPLAENHPSWAELVSVEQHLETLREKPLLICWGGKDFCFNDSFYEEWLRRFPAASSHYFSQAGHYVLEDALDEIVPLVSNFLETCQAQAG